MIRVLLVDDHTMVRKGLRMLLEGYPELEIVGESQDGCEAVDMTDRLQPDVVVMDLSMPSGLDGFAACREIRRRHPSIKTVILTMHDEEIFVRQSVRVEADGYILKNSHGELLHQAIVEVVQGNRFYKTSVSDDVLRQWMHADEQRQPSPLTTRQKQIVRLTVLGYANKEIAEQLSISVKTVENHKTNIMQKLELDTKHELIQYAIKNNYLELAL